ncbi:MAG: PAS domain-containing protein [Salinivirgaceae bacterium]|nr:PAS domain-containing protein [Salinivirgaceae bacterium]
MDAIIKKGVVVIKNKAAFYEKLVNTVGASIHIIKIDKKGRTLPVWINERYPYFFGYSLKERRDIGFADHINNFYHPDDVELIKYATNKALKERNRFHLINFRIKDKSGNWQWLTISSQALTIENDPDYLLIVAVPIHNVPPEFNVLLDRYYKEIKQLRNELKLNKLSKTEKKVIELYVTGLTTKEIAIKRNRSFNTINNHKRNVFKKLNIHNMAELVAFAKDSGLI